MKQEPDLGAIRALSLVAQVGSISAASSTLGVSQQAVSLRIRALEHELGVPLLLRSARGSQLTQAGELVLRHGRSLLTAAAAYSDAVSLLGADSERTLRIVASLTVAEHLLPGWITRWRSTRGDGGPVALLTAANSAAVSTAVLAGSADLGFVETPTLPPGLNSVCVGYDRIEIVVAHTHRWAGQTITPAELAATPLVLRETGSGTRRALEDALLAAGTPLAVAPAAVHDTTLGVRSAVMAGLAPGALSVLAVRGDVREGRLARVRIAGLETARPLTAVWRGAAPCAAAAELLAGIAGIAGAAAQADP